MFNLSACQSCHPLDCQIIAEIESSNCPILECQTPVTTSTTLSPATTTNSPNISNRQSLLIVLCIIALISTCSFCVGFLAR